MKGINLNLGEIIFLVVIIFALGFAISKITTNQTKNSINFTPENIPNSEYQIINNCKNLDLINTSKCFRDNVETFFKYDSDGIEIRLEDDIYKIETREDRVLSIKEVDNSFVFIDYLKENGGECEQWSLFYNNLCKNTNFECDLAVNGNSIFFNGHEYAVIGNETHYCELDQLNIKCYKRTK